MAQVNRAGATIIDMHTFGQLRSYVVEYHWIGKDVIGKPKGAWKRVGQDGLAAPDFNPGSLFQGNLKIVIDLHASLDKLRPLLIPTAFEVLFPYFYHIFTCFEALRGEYTREEIENKDHHAGLEGTTLMSVRREPFMSRLLGLTTMPFP